ncbi:hypothetical protein KPH14_002623 [Odynerus spinipes]|uniref:Uncharacterized protein n=1 Tax=Odynerus spinipes TaxID=1348599 RepID=A0AAD9RF87_9HYME|nr:hypothetical protein KPH14_002623 [Odynerus spinipes]
MFAVLTSILTGTVGFLLALVSEMPKAWTFLERTTQTSNGLGLTSGTEAVEVASKSKILDPISPLQEY